MSGHSKWATIKRKKEVTDAKRGAVFTKFGRLLSIAAKSGTNPESNFKLKLAIEKAREANMPKANIERAIDKGGGKSKEGQFEEFKIEAIGPYGISMIIEGVSDNKNRTLSEIRNILDKYHAKTATAGSLNYLFEAKGVIRVSNSNDEIELSAIGAGAEDTIKDENILEIYTKPASINSLKESIIEAGGKIESADINLIPKNQISLEKAETEKTYKLMDELDENDDVTGIYSNLK